MVESTKKGRIKRMEKQVPSTPQHEPSQGRKFLLITVGVLVLLVLSPWLWYLYNSSPEPTRPNVQLEHEIQEVVDNIRHYIISNATELIESDSNYNSNMEGLQAVINNNINKIIVDIYQPFFIKGKNIEIIVNYCEVQLSPSFKNTMDLDKYPRYDNFEELKLNVYAPDKYSEQTVPFNFFIQGNIELTGRELNTDDPGSKIRDSIKRDLHFQDSINIPNLFIDYKLQQFENQANTAFSDLSRIMKYMLTTLARLRAYSIDDFGSKYSHKNIINEGDIELCLNIALLLEQALLLRAYDKTAIDAIDNYFYNAYDALTLNNPTGKRQWGTAEQVNYDEYIYRRLQVKESEKRTLSNLVNNYVTTGYVDPADFLAFYLALDKAENIENIGSPRDTQAILQQRFETHYFMDSRVTLDPSDTTNLKYILSLASDYKNGFNISSNITGSTHYQSLQLQVDQKPNYLVFGADFKATGLDDPRGWYTKAKDRNSTGTRTSTTIPESPNDHDYRLEWDIKIQGKFELNLKPKTDVQNKFSNNFWQKREIEFDLPINIYIWFNKNPHVDPVDFIDLTSGLTETIAAKTYWIINSESHLAEYFEDKFWVYLKPFFSLSFDTAYSILPFVLSQQGYKYNNGENSNYLEKVSTGYNSITSNWLCDILLFQKSNLKQILNENLDNFWIKFNTFMFEYMLDYLNQYNEEFGLYNYTSQPQFPHPQLRPWISVLGYEITLHYDRDADILKIQLLHPNGSMVLLINGYKGSKDKLSITLKNQFELTGVINISTTVTSFDTLTGTGLVNPGIFADGMLFDKYRFSTQAYPNPGEANGAAVADHETNEQFLSTRAKFCKLNPVVTLEFPELTISDDLENIDLEITLILPEEDKNKGAALNNKFKDIFTDLEKRSEFRSKPGEILMNRIYISQFCDVLSSNLLSWLEDNEGTKLGIDFAIDSTESDEFINYTIFLTEQQSTENFIKWLGKFGLEIIQIMGNPNSFLTELGYILTRDNPLFTSEDLLKLDIEVYYRDLDLKPLKNMRVSENLLNAYQLPDDQGQKLILIQTLSGDALLALGEGLKIGIDNNNNDNEIVTTYGQMYYGIQQVGDKRNSVDILVGTTWFK